MWQSEFETRTGVTVTAEEYAHIEAVYMMSDLDKDAFCNQWKRSNRTFIARRKAQIAAAEALRELKFKLRRVLGYLRNAMNTQHWLPAYMPAEYVAICKSAGVNVCQSAWGITAEIEDFLER